MGKEEIILSLIKNECDKNIVASEPRILKMASVLSIDKETTRQIIKRLNWQKKIKKSGLELTLFRKV